MDKIKRILYPSLVQCNFRLENRALNTNVSSSFRIRFSMTDNNNPIEKFDVDPLKEEVRKLPNEWPKTSKEPRSIKSRFIRYEKKALPIRYVELKEDKQQSKVSAKPKPMMVKERTRPAVKISIPNVRVIPKTRPASPKLPPTSFRRISELPMSPVNFKVPMKPKVQYIINSSIVKVY